MSRYTFVLQDLVSGTIKEEVPLRSVRYGKVLNAPGFLEASIDYRHPKATASNFARCRTAVYVLRDDVCVWGGILWTLRRNGDGLNIGCEGFWSYFRKRRLRHTKSYTDTSPLDIARDLIDYAQDPVLSVGGDIGVITGTETTTAVTTRTWYGYERRVIADIIEALTDNTISFDFEIDTVYDPVANTFNKHFRLYAPRQGRKTNTTWEIGPHAELSQYFLDGTKQENTVHAIGAGEGDAMLLTTVADSNQVGTFPLLEGVLVAKDISAMPTLLDHAQARLQRRRMPGATPAVYLKPGDPSTQVGSFMTGDEIKLTGGDGFCTFDQYFRIDTWEVDLSDEGKERVRVEFIDATKVDEDQ